MVGRISNTSSSLDERNPTSKRWSKPRTFRRRYCGIIDSIEWVHAAVRQIVRSQTHGIWKSNGESDVLLDMH